MKIESYEQSVTPYTPKIQAPRQPDPVQGAFLTGVPQAVERLGNVLQQHAQEQYHLAQEANISKLDTDFRLEMQNRLLSSDTEKSDVNGKKSERTIGILNRSNAEAVGSSIEFEEWYPKTKQKYLDGVSDPKYRASLAKSLDSQYLGGREMVIKHEAKQQRSALIKTYQANLTQQTHDASAITDPALLKPAVEQAMKTAESISLANDDDPVTSENKKKDAAGDIVSKSVLSTLMSTGDLKVSQKMLLDNKDYLHADRFEKLSESLATGAERLQKQTELIDTQKRIEGEANWLSRIATGEATWMNMDDLSKDVRSGIIDEKTATAFADVLKRNGKYIPRDEENINFPSVMAGIYSANTKEEIHNSLLQMLRDHKNISQDKLAVMISGALQRAQSLPYATKFNDIKENNSKNVNPKQREIDGAAKMIIDFGRTQGFGNDDISDMYHNYIVGITNGVAPREAYESAVKAVVVAKNPASAASIVPTIVINGSSPTRFYLKKNDTDQPQWIYDPATKKMKQNPNFKKQRPNAANSSGQ